MSLREAFERGHELQDLAVRPHERIALMRLLICVAQAALNGPADTDEWESCRPRIAPAALDYLDRWQTCLRAVRQRPAVLAGRESEEARARRSLRTVGGDDEGTPTSKLDLALATGNNTTLFDNAGGSERAFTPGRSRLDAADFPVFLARGDDWRCVMEWHSDGGS